MEERKEQESSDGGHLEYLCFCLDYGDLEWITYKCVQHISRDLLEVVIADSRNNVMFQFNTATISSSLLFTI